MGENSTQTASTPRLAFRIDAGLSSREAADGSTAYVAEAEGVRYRIVGSYVLGTRTRRFRAFRVTGVASLPKLTPAGEGGEHKTRAAAYAQAEADLAEVLRDRERPAGEVLALAGVTVATHHVTNDGEVAPRPTAAAAELDPVVHSLPALARRAESLAEYIRAAEALTASADDPDAALSVLTDRLVRRAQYGALKAALAVLAGWVESVRTNCEAGMHSGTSTHLGGPCGEQFHVTDIRNMINDTARELGTALPWRAVNDA